MVVVEGTPTRLEVVVEDSGDLIVYSADIADAEPTWDSYTVDPSVPSDASVHIAGRTMSGVPGHVYVAYTTSTEARFARSDDGGVTFDAPIVLAGFPSDHSTAASLTEDAGNRVRFVWVDNDPTTETSTLSYCEAVNGGAVSGDWNAPIVLDVFDSDDHDVAVSIAGEPGTNQLLVTTQEVVSFDSTTRLYHSSDGGGTWDHIGDVALLHSAQLFWGSEGPGFAAIHDWWSSGYWLARPESTPTGDWTAEVMLSLRPSPVFLAVDGAADPTTGEFAMVGTSNEVDLCDLWFDGEWRDAPGYGISEPGAPFELERIINSAPAIQDVDGDGDRDVVFTTAGDSIGYYDPGADEIVWVGEVGPTSEASAPVVVDVDGDRLYEIFVGTDNGRVHALRADGSTLAGWPVNLGTTAPVYLSAGGDH